MVLIIFHCQFDALYNRPLPFRADLLSPLECHKRHLKVMRRLLECRLLMGLNDFANGWRVSATCKNARVPVKKHTNEACIAESFFKLSDPLFAIARVDSVKSCLFERETER